MQVPPAENGFLIEDVRFGVGKVRPINGPEQWQMHGLSDGLAADLRQLHSVSEAELGQLSGSSIPKEVCELQVTKLKARIDFVHQLEALQGETGVPWQHSDAPSAEGHYKRQVQLMVIRLDGTAAVLTDVTLQSLPGKCYVQPRLCIRCRSRLVSALGCEAYWTAFGVFLGS